MESTGCASAVTNSDPGPQQGTAHSVSTMVPEHGGGIRARAAACCVTPILARSRHFRVWKKPGELGSLFQLHLIGLHPGIPPLEGLSKFTIDHTRPRL